LKLAANLKIYDNVSHYAWCHLRNGIRSFSIDTIIGVESTDDPAREIDKAELMDHFDQGYGIFSGARVQYVRLKFTPAQARWVAQES